MAAVGGAAGALPELNAPGSGDKLVSACGCAGKAYPAAVTRPVILLYYCHLN